MGYVRLGSEFLVNSSTSSDQSLPTITTLASGRLVVSWADYGGSADTGRYLIKAQILSATGAKIGGEFLVNAPTFNFISEPTISSLASGGFVVSWVDSDASGLGIQAQVFDASGAKIGSELRVNTTTFASQENPRVTSLASGGFVVTWDDLSRQGGDTSLASIRAQIFDGSGAKVGTEFLVNTTTLANQNVPTITSLASGGFVVSWSDNSGQGGDTSGWGIKAQIFDAAGGKVGSEFPVNTTTLNNQFRPMIASLASGSFVVSWEDGSGLGGDASQNGIRAQIFNNLGAKVGNEFLVNASTLNDQSGAAITSLYSGGFVVSWRDNSGQGGDPSGYSIKAQVFEATGVKVGSELLVNTATLNDQFMPTITSLASGGFAVSWADASGQGGDASGYSIKAQIFTPDTIEGSAGNDALVGTIAQETLYGRAGDDTLNGGAGPDTMVGGSGNDTYIVDSLGDVVIEAPGEGTDTVKASVGSRTNVSQIYKLPAEVENLLGTAAVAQGVSGNALNNAITMGNGGDLVLLHDGGDDTVIGGGGNDFIYYGGAFTNGDRNDGGAGTDTVGLIGSYVITFDADDLVSIEKLAAYSAGDATGAVANNYNFTMIDANVAAGTQMLVIAQSLLAHEKLTFDGSAETDGKFYVKGGRGNDTITGGLGNDTIFGHLGADVLKGGGGNDVFQYVKAEESTATSRDTILDFSAGDKINLVGIDADPVREGNNGFTFLGTAAFTNKVGQLRAYEANGGWVVEGDIDGDGTADLVIEVQTVGGHALVAADFLF
jgi:Ca2+-binding RTX toxin-like protein